MSDRTRSALILLPLIASCLWRVSRSVVLTPSSISACSGNAIIVRCSESDTSTMHSMRWTITPKSRLIPVVELTVSKDTTENQRIEYGVLFYSELTSYSPLTSVLTTTAHPALNGATVTCQSIVSMDMLKITVVEETDQPEIRWLNIEGEMFEADNLTIIIEWDSNTNFSCFTVSLTPPNGPSSNFNITTTNNTSFNILYNTNYTVTVFSCSGNYSSEISETINFIKCESPSYRDNVNVSGDFPALENSQVSLSCLPGYSFSDMEDTTVIGICTSEGIWWPDFSQLECQRDCGQLPSMEDVYTILNETNNTTEGSVIEFECVHTHPLNKPLIQAECLSSGLWQPHPKAICGQETTNEGYGNLIIIAPLGVGIPIVCLCLVGTAAVVLYCLVIRRKRGSSKDDDKHSAEDSQNQDNHTIEHWGIYSLLQQPEAAAESTRNSTVYAEIGPGSSHGGKKAAAIPLDTTVTYAVINNKQDTEQQQQRAMDLDLKVVLNLDNLLLKLHSQVSPKWHQFGLAIGVPVETLDELSAYQEEDRLSEITDYWMKHQGELTWREVALKMEEIGLHDLAEEILSDHSIDEIQLSNEVAQYQQALSSTNLSDEAETDDFTATPPPVPPYRS